MEPNTQTQAAQGGTESQQLSADMNGAMDSWGDGDATPVQQSETPVQQQQQAPAQQVPSRPVPKTEAAAPTPAATPALDPAKLIEAAVNSTAQAFQRTQQAAAPKPEAKPMSDEEFAARYGIVKYDAKTMERLFDKDPTKAAAVLNEIQTNAYQAAVRMANDLLQAQLAQAKGTYDPRIGAMEKFVSEQREAQANARFYAAFPDLKDEHPMVQEILNAVNDRVSKGQLTFKDEAEAFKFVADATNTRIAQMRERYGGQAPAGGQGAGRGQQPPPQRQMAMASSSARPSGAKPRQPSDMENMMSGWDALERPAD